MKEEQSKNSMNGAHLYFKCDPFAGRPLYFACLRGRVPTPPLGNRHNIFREMPNKTGGPAIYDVDFEAVARGKWSPWDESLRAVLITFNPLNPSLIKRGAIEPNDDQQIKDNLYSLRWGRESGLMQLSMYCRFVPSPGSMLEEFEDEVVRDISRAIRLNLDEHKGYFHILGDKERKSFRGDLGEFVQKLIHKYHEEMGYPQMAIDEKDPNLFSYLRQLEGAICGIEMDMKLFCSDTFPIKPWWSEDICKTTPLKHLEDIAYHLKEHSTKTGESAKRGFGFVDYSGCSHKYESKVEPISIKQDKRAPLIKS